MRKVNRFRANSLPQVLRLVYEFKTANKTVLDNRLPNRVKLRSEGLTAIELRVFSDRGTDVFDRG
jgi:hypothetical protein